MRGFPHRYFPAVPGPVRVLVTAAPVHRLLPAEAASRGHSVRVLDHLDPQCTGPILGRRCRRFESRRATCATGRGGCGRGRLRPVFHCASAVGVARLCTSRHYFSNVRGTHSAGRLADLRRPPEAPRAHLIPGYGRTSRRPSDGRPRSESERGGIARSRWTGFPATSEPSGGLPTPEDPLFARTSTPHQALPGSSVSALGCVRDPRAFPGVQLDGRANRSRTRTPACSPLLSRSSRAPRGSRGRCQSATSSPFTRVGAFYRAVRPEPRGVYVGAVRAPDRRVSRRRRPRRGARLRPTHRPVSRATSPTATADVSRLRPSSLHPTLVWEDGWPTGPGPGSGAQPTGRRRFRPCRPEAACARLVSERIGETRS